MNKAIQIICSYEGLNEDTIKLINLFKKIKNDTNLMNLSSEEFIKK